VGSKTCVNKLPPPPPACAEEGNRCVCCCCCLEAEGTGGLIAARTLEDRHCCAGFCCPELELKFLNLAQKTDFVASGSKRNVSHIAASASNKHGCTNADKDATAPSENKASTDATGNPLAPILRWGEPGAVMISSGLWYHNSKSLTRILRHRCERLELEPSLNGWFELPHLLNLEPLRKFL
jgi:hypothetical protein